MGVEASIPFLGRVALVAAFGLRTDFTATALRRLARYRRDARQIGRLVALAVMYDGGSQSEVVRIGGVGLQTVRDWALRFSRRGPDGLIDGKALRAGRA